MNPTPPLRVPVLRRLGIAAVATSALAAGWVLPTPAASAADSVDVLVFNDPGYVDTDEEGLHMQQVLEAGGDTVSTVDTASAAALGAALVGKQTFVIPETEEGSLSSLDDASIQVVQDWVDAGGTLVFGLDDGTNVNTLFGTDVTTAGMWPEGETWSLAPSPGPVFAGGPSKLGYNDGTTSLTTSSLPVGATAEYADAASDSAVVYDFAYGSGTVVGLGWDWYDALTPENSAGQDGGWNDVLLRAASIAPADTTAPRTTITKVAKEKVKAGARGDQARAKVTVTFKADEPSTFRCKVDSKAYAPCASPFVVRLKAAQHTVRVVATDEAGNTDSTPASRTFQVTRAKRS